MQIFKYLILNYFIFIYIKHIYIYNICDSWRMLQAIFGNTIKKKKRFPLSDR